MRVANFAQRYLNIEALEGRRLLAAEVIIGENAPSRNLLPFGGTGFTRYQQVYSATEFPGPLSINGVKFFNNPLVPEFPSTLSIGTLNFEFSVTAKEVDGLDTVNLENNVTSVVLGYGTLELDGEQERDLIVNITPFSYDPSLGNLLMDIKTPTGLTRVGFPAFFSSYDPDEGISAGGIFSRAMDGGWEGYEGYGLKTAFLIGTTPLDLPEVQVIVSDGNLKLIGDDAANEIVISQGTTPNEFVLSSPLTDFGNGPGVSVTVSGITGDVIVELGDAADTLRLGGTNSILTLPGELMVHAGAGDNVIQIGADVTSGQTSSVNIAGDVEIEAGAGDDQVRLGGSMLGNYDSLTGNVSLKIGGDVEMDLGDGDNSAVVGGDVGYYSNLNIEIAGDVDISHGDGNNTTVVGGDSYYGRVSILIDGDVEIQNGAGLNRTDIGTSNTNGFSDFSLVEIGGDVEIDNGDGGNLTRVGMDIYYGFQTLRILGDVEISNGNGDDTTLLGGGGYYGASRLEIAGDVSVDNRKGNDTTRIGSAGGYDGLSSVTIDGDVLVKDGQGDDNTRIGGSGVYYSDSLVHIAGDVELRGGAGNDTFRVGGDGDKYGDSRVTIGGDFLIAAGKDDDDIEIGGRSGRFGFASVSFGGSLKIQGGEGNDKILLRTQRNATLSIANELRINGGDGNDNIRLVGVSVSGPTVLRGDEGNDKIRIKDSFFAHLVKVKLGDQPNDLYEDLGGNVFEDGFLLF